MNTTYSPYFSYALRIVEIFFKRVTEVPKEICVSWSLEAIFTHHAPYNNCAAMVQILSTGSLFLKFCFVLVSVW